MNVSEEELQKLDALARPCIVSITQTRDEAPTTKVYMLAQGDDPVRTLASVAAHRAKFHDVRGDMDVEDMIESFVQTLRTTGTHIINLVFGNGDSAVTLMLGESISADDVDSLDARVH